MLFTLITFAAPRSRQPVAFCCSIRPLQGSATTMHPPSNQVCLSFSDPKKRYCITIPTFEDIQQFFVTFHREISEYLFKPLGPYSDKGRTLSCCTSIHICGCAVVLGFLPQTPFPSPVLRAVRPTPKYHPRAIYLSWVRTLWCEAR